MIVTKIENNIQAKVRNKSRIVLRPLKLKENNYYKNEDNENDKFKQFIPPSSIRQNSEGKYNYENKEDNENDKFKKFNSPLPIIEKSEEKMNCILSNGFLRFNEYGMKEKINIFKINKNYSNNINFFNKIKNNVAFRNKKQLNNKQKYTNINTIKEEISENNRKIYKEENNEIDKEQQIKEKQKINKLKDLMFKRQNYMRIKNKSIDEEIEEENNNEKINQFLEDMCIYGNIMKKEIEENQSESRNKYIKIEDALKMEKEDSNLFCLGLLANNLEGIGIKVLIENNKVDNNEVIPGYEDIIKEEKEGEALTSLQFIISGYIYKTKYILHFDFGEEENEELLNNIEKYNDFKNILKTKLSRDYQTPTDKIIVTYPQRGSFVVQVIFQSDEFNDLDLEAFCNKFRKEKHFKKLIYLKKIHSDLIMPACILSKKAFDPLGNRIEGWGVDEKRGKQKYYPPLNWIGIGLKVLDKYENNIWIGMDNVNGEWCVAYHGVGGGYTSEKVKNVLGLIYKGGLKAGKAQAHEFCDDYYNEGKKVGRGVYCSPRIETAKKFAGIRNINGKKYYTVLMLRVKPSKIRHCYKCNDSKKPYYYWVLNGTPDEIRPYRILYKCIDDKEKNME